MDADPLGRELRLAEAAYDLNRHELTARHAVRALALCPDSARAKYHLARSLYLRNRDDEAEPLFLELIASDPDVAHAYGYLGDICRYRGDPASLRTALAWYRQARTRDPGRASRTRWVVHVLRRLGRADDAADEAEGALAQHPQNAGLLEEAARVALDRNRRVAAARLTRRLLRAAPDDPEAHDVMESLALTYGRFRLAAHHHRLRTRLDPGSADSGDTLPQRLASALIDRCVYPGPALALLDRFPLRRYPFAGRPAAP
ncbi:MAG: tetratricopeptide repeat protein [Planctomycetota bacterium]